MDAPSGEHSLELAYFFGSLFRSMLTMLEVILGGVNWDKVVVPLIADISPVAGIIFGAYIAFCLFAMMNLVTGVFVESALRTAREEDERNAAKHIADVFLQG